MVFRLKRRIFGYLFAIGFEDDGPGNSASSALSWSYVTMEPRNDHSSSLFRVRRSTAKIEEITDKRTLQAITTVLDASPGLLQDAKGAKP